MRYLYGFVQLSKEFQNLRRVERISNPRMYLKESEKSLCSVNSDEPTFFRLVNLTRRKVAVYWVDYKGNIVLYNTLTYRQFIDISTYVSHPWIVVDTLTKQRCLVNCKDVYFPEPARIRGWRVPQHQQQPQPEIERPTVYITLPMYSLRDLCIQVIKQRLTADSQAFLLQLPWTLQREIAHAEPRKASIKK